MPPLAVAFSSLGHVASSLARVSGTAIARGLPTVVPGPSTAHKTYMYHGPTRSVVHEAVYPEQDGRQTWTAVPPGSAAMVETRVDKRRRALKSVLKHKLRRDRWALAAAGIHVWRLSAGEEFEWRRMQERVKRDTDEVQQTDLTEVSG